MLSLALFIYNLCLIPILLAAVYLGMGWGYFFTCLSVSAGVILLFLRMNPVIVFASIIVFVLSLFIVKNFKKIQENSLSFISLKKDELKNTIESLNAEDANLSKKAKELEVAVLKIVNLYEIARAFGIPLRFNNLFAVLTQVLQGLFEFDTVKLLLLKEIGADYQIDRVYRIEKKAAPEAVEITDADSQLVKDILKRQDRIFIKDDHLVFTLVIGERTLGVLALWGINQKEFERLQIIANQFAFALERVRLYEMVQETSIVDGLTNIFVRRHFLERMEEELNRANKYNHNLSFIMVDIDHFKKCNDRFGHLVGDVVLKEIADILRINLREVDLVGRYGGEEFSAALPDTGKKEALSVAERIRAAVENTTIRAYDEKINTTISIGLATYPEDADNLLKLIECADSALYKAKQEGRNKVCVFNSERLR